MEALIYSDMSQKNKLVMISQNTHVCLYTLRFFEIILPNLSHFINKSELPYVFGFEPK